MAYQMATGILIMALAITCAAHPLPPPPRPDIHATIDADKGNWRQEILAEQLDVRKLTAEYNKNQNWKDLRTGLEAGLDPNSVAYKQLQTIPLDSTNPLKIIGSQGMVELAALLVLVGTSPEIADGCGHTLLQGAAIGGQGTLARMLLDAGANIEAKDNWGSTPLVLASKHEQQPMVEFLLDRGADVNGASYYGWTALYWAADNGNYPMVQFLVRAGASTTLEDRDGKTPLQVAKDKDRTHVVEYLSRVPN